jgi:hypothetical protein
VATNVAHMPQITIWSVQIAMFQGSRVADIVNFFNVHNYKKNNLVYIGTPKCGSRYYTTLLTENGWRRIHFWEIDWDNIHAVGFIRDPLERYLKGVVQDIFESESTDFDDCVTKMIGEFNKFNLPMTPHSVPITMLLQDYYHKINWIPVGNNSHEEFLKICEQHQISIENYDSENIDPHHSDSNKQQYYERIKTAFGHGNELYHLFFEKDHKLYDEAKKKFKL